MKLFVLVLVLTALTVISCKEIEIDENPPSNSRGLVIDRISNNYLTSTDSASFNVRLNTRPSTAITVTPNIVANPTNSVTISPTNHTLNTENWNGTTDHTFTVSSVCDNNSVDSTFEIAFSTSNDLTGNAYPNTLIKVDSLFEDQNNLNFEKLNSTTIGGTITEVNNVKISENSTSTTEEGGLVGISVVLCKQPTANTTITATSSDTTEGTLSAGSLTFTTSNWSTAQNLVVTGQDDQLVDTKVDYQINFSASPYDNTTNPVPLTNYDNETPEIVPNVSVLAGNVNEAGSLTQTFTVALSKEPISDIVVNLSINNDEANLNIRSITFSPPTYNLPVTVVVSGIDDTVNDGDQNFTITINAVSGTGYINASPVYITGTNIDND